MDHRELECRLDSCGSGRGVIARFYEHSNEHLCSIKGREFLDQLSD